MEKLTNKEIKSLMNFIEEFTWVSNKYKDIDVKKLYNFLNDSSKNNNVDFDNKYYIKSNKKLGDKSFLIGCLPSLLMDRELFVKNKDLADFAKLMGIDVRFPEKRSRDEIIGTIICSLQDESNEMKIIDICNFINELISNEKLIENIKIEKKIFNENYDWNRVIRHLYIRK